jgi:hypothetical protein
MEKVKNLLKPIAAALMLLGMFAACEGPQGPAGPQGPQGEQGEPGPGSVVNWEGYKEGIVCASCHNPDYDTTYFVWGRKYEWILSKHSYGGDYERNAADCAGCHTTEGYVQRETGRTVTSNTHASPPGCFACHSPHSRGDFSLRTTEPVTVTSAVAGVSDLTFDYGKGNLCVSCHKTRSLTPEPDPNSSAPITITSNRWYPHYGVQGQMLAGTGGFEFAGVSYNSSYHTVAQTIKDEGCVICHMADPNAGTGQGGGHTMNIRYEGTHGEAQELTTGCTTTGCHSSPMHIDYNGVQTETAALLDSLQTLLIERGWLTSSGLVNASSSNPLVITPGYLSGALFNYFFVEHDLSEGVHNTNYAQKLLTSSIDALNSK